MKMITSILLLALLTGCGKDFAFTAYREHASSVQYTLLENNGWNIIPARKGEWRSYEGKAYLPQYFSSEDVKAQYYKSNNNFLYALYNLNDNTALAVWIKFYDGFVTDKDIFLSFRGNPVREESYDVREDCEKYERQAIVVTFNAVDVNFDSSSFYFIKDTKKTFGTEIADIGRGLNEATTYHPSIYNLASKDTIQKKQIYSGLNREKKPKWYFPYPSFTYKFLVTCTDLENAILVIDGLYYKGVRLPPLKVRLNYYDFSRVPQYKGPAGTEIAQ